jgi:hypothetical protein
MTTPPVSDPLLPRTLVDGRARGANEGHHAERTCCTRGVMVASDGVSHYCNKLFHRARFMRKRWPKSAPKLRLLPGSLDRTSDSSVKPQSEFA